MKKFILTLTPLLLILCFQINVKASAIPEVSQATFQVIQGGMQDTISAGASYKGLSPYSDGIIATYEVLGNLYLQYMNLTKESYELWSCSADDVVVTELSEESKDYIESHPLINRNGEVVDIDNIYHLSYENSFFHGSLFLDENGDVLYYLSDTNNVKRLSANCVFGGSLVESTDWNNFYDFLHDECTDNNFNVSFSDVNFSDISLFYWIGYTSYSAYADPEPTKQEMYLYIPDGYNFGNVCAYLPNQSYYFDTIACNRGAGYDYYLNLISGGSYSYIGGENFGPYDYISDYLGYNYQGKIHIIPKEDFNNLSLGNLSYSQFLNYQPLPGESEKYYQFCYHNNLNYNTLMALKSSSDPVYSFKPLQFPNGSFIHPEPIPVEMDLSQIHELLQNIEQTELSKNELFDPQQELNALNNPIIYECNYYLPDGSNYPGLVPGINPGINPGGNPFPFPQIDPNVGINIEPVPNIQPNDDMINYSNPFVVTGLEARFPFSIPWELKTMARGLISEPKAPSWDFIWNITAFGHTYSYHCQGDLSAFDSLATLLRRLLLIATVVALAIASYKMFF